MKTFFLLIIVLSLTSCSTTSTNTCTNDHPSTPQKQTTKEATPSACQNTETSFKCVKVVEVYDGDTIFIDLPDQHPLFGRRMGVRVLGVDTPELRTTDSCEKKKGLEAKAALQKIFSQSTSVDILNVEKDKYFRILGDVYVDGKSVAQELINLRLAYPYSGEKKVKRNWCR